MSQLNTIKSTQKPRIGLWLKSTLGSIHLLAGTVPFHSVSKWNRQYGRRVCDVCKSEGEDRE